MSDTVSVVMATIPERRILFKQALKYFLRQTHPNKELVVVSDGGDFDQTDLPVDPRIQYVSLKDPTPLGTKLNIGIEYTRGSYILKMDDDDWYHPRFMETAIQVLFEKDPELGITRFRRFPMLILKHMWLRAVGYYDTKAGNAMCFNRKMWERKPFQDIPRRVDTHFWEDHPEHTDVIIDDSGLACMVRHGIRHLWTEYTVDMTVDDLFEKWRPEYQTPIERFFSPEDLEFYKHAREEIYKDAAQTGSSRVGL